MQSWGSRSPHVAVSAEHLDLCGELSGTSGDRTCRESAHAPGQSLSPGLSPISCSHVQLSQEELGADGSVGTGLRQWHSLCPCYRKQRRMAPITLLTFYGVPVFFPPNPKIQDMRRIWEKLRPQ